MKNYLFGIIFIVILPASFGNSESTGCNSKKSGYSEEQSEQSQKAEDKKEEESDKNKQSGGNTDTACYPFFSIE